MMRIVKGAAVVLLCMFISTTGWGADVIQSDSAQGLNVLSNGKLIEQAGPANIQKTGIKDDVKSNAKPVLNDKDTKVQDAKKIQESRKLKTSSGVLKNTDRFPMAWQLSSTISDVHLYSLFTPADLGGYGENNPPYEPSDPQPADGATEVALDVTLQWTGGDPDGDTVTYDVYFGTDSSPPLVMSDSPNTFYSPDNLSVETHYYWKIVARDALGAETEGPVWSFTTRTNNAPYEPINPIPPDGSTDVDVNADLSWQCNDPDPGDTLTFDVYFGDVNPPALVASDVSELSYDPGELHSSTTYYWKIIARDNWGAETSSALWTFETMAGTENNPPDAPSNPSPQDGATEVDVNATLSWACSDPDGDDVVFDVYFGTENPPALVAADVEDATYDPDMSESQTYFWKIVARDSHQASTEGPVWSFTTKSPPTPTPVPPTPTPTPRPPTATPTEVPPNTPTPKPCAEFTVDIDMGGSYFCPGDTFYLNADLCNPGEQTYLLLFVILEFQGEFWFAPSWTQDIDYYNEPVPTGWSTKEVIPEITWPEVTESYSARFWGALVNLQMTDIVGNYDMEDFSWGPCH